MTGTSRSSMHCMMPCVKADLQIVPAVVVPVVVTVVKNHSASPETCATGCWRCYGSQQAPGAKPGELALLRP